ncbi:MULTISPECIES: S8 family peptidase [Eisenbergiella]|uniref:S8 family peptidase n=1 Tax=Eisenbergiella porci TaxID=2652274 RepID=A0A6N7WFC6_9FIRM|nr:MULTISPECIES: S8 family peptidase [Eisenbergiella]MDY2654287.1 S8 family peptidase [Eisenbergiella porci]MSS89167.1 S8 family peptidase [Eisenbergiella porci]
MTCKEKILSEDYMDLINYFILPEGIVQGNDDVFCYIPINERFLSIYYSRAMLPPLEVSSYFYRYIPRLYGLMDLFVPEALNRNFDPQPLIRSGISFVQKEPLNLTGRNVVLGFADTGIDYRNPVFRREDGSTRILAIWDQSVQTGTPPDGLIYGSEYTREQINEALRLDNPLELVPVTDDIGHGTAMASAAAGSALNGGIDFLGAAPDADIVVVKLKQAKQFLRDYYMTPPGVPAYGTNDIMLAVKYLSSFCIPFQRPAVICLGVGSSFGGHTGNSALSQYISTVGTQINQVVVVAGGNEGNSAHHFSGHIDGTGSVNVEIRVSEGTRGFLLETWGSVPDFFSISVRSPGGEVIPPVSGRLGQSLEYTFVYEKTRIRLDYQPVEADTGKEVAVLRFENPTQGIWTVIVIREGGNGSGNFNMWLPIRQFIDGTAEFLQPNPETTLTSPSFAQPPMAVTAYNSRNNSFYYNSGQGFGADGEIKPDLSAPGVDISVATGTIQGRTVVGTGTGTSLAAALTAGAAAQFMQWAVVEDNSPYAGGISTRNYFLRGAARDAAYTYPSRQWGMGRLDMEGVFNWIAGILP